MGKDLKGVKCPPGQVWAFNKNPRCSLSFSDAVFENTSPDCPYPPSATSEYACVCPCKRKFMLTFKVDFEIDLIDDATTSLDTECQLCRSEKQILIHGLNLSLMDKKKCERTVRRATKDWVNTNNPWRQDGPKRSTKLSVNYFLSLLLIFYIETTSTTLLELGNNIRYRFVKKTTSYIVTAIVSGIYPVNWINSGEILSAWFILYIKTFLTFCFTAL